MSKRAFERDRRSVRQLGANANVPPWRAAIDLNVERQEETPMHAVLVGCDLESLATLRTYLQGQGIDIRGTVMPHQFFGRVGNYAASLIIIQWPLREVSGESVVRRIRELFRGATPIVAMGLRDNADDAIAALNSGADDFISSESPSDVSMARIRAVVQRYRIPAMQQSQSMRFGEYQIEYRSQTVTLRGERIPLTPKELDLFWVFVTNFERLMPKAELMACVWGQSDAIDTHTVSQHVHTLRTKLSLARNGLHLAAVYGAGYRLQGRPAA